MLFNKLSVFLAVCIGLCALLMESRADYVYREIRIRYLNTSSVSHLHNPLFLNPQTPVNLDLADVFHQRPPFQAMNEQIFQRELLSNKALASAVSAYAGILEAMVDALNATSQAPSGVFIVRGLPAKELLQRLASAAKHDIDTPEGTAIQGIFTDWRQEESGLIRTGSDPLLHELGIQGVECTNTPPAHVGDGVEFPLPVTTCAFQR